jgi:hypothetical protein
MPENGEGLDVLIVALQACKRQPLTKGGEQAH